jgi:hypothetical protein
MNRIAVSLFAAGLVAAPALAAETAKAPAKTPPAAAATTTTTAGKSTQAKQPEKVASVKKHRRAHKPSATPSKAPAAGDAKTAPATK